MKISQKIIHTGILLAYFLSGFAQGSKGEQDSINCLIEDAKDSARYYMVMGDDLNAFKQIKLSHRYVSDNYSDTSYEYVRSLVNMSIAYNTTLEFDSALHYITRANLLYSEVVDKDPLFYGVIYFNYGRIFISQGNYLLADEYLHQARNILTQSAEDKSIYTLIRVNQMLGSLCRDIGEFNQSLNYYRDNFKIIKNSGIPFNRELILNYTGYAWTFHEMGNYDESISILKKALMIAKSDSINFVSSLAVTYNNLAMDYIRLQKFDSAKSSLDASLKIELLSNNSRSSLISLYDSYSQLYQEMGELKYALFYSQKSLFTLVGDTSMMEEFNNPDQSYFVDKVRGIRYLNRKTKILAEIYKESNKKVIIEAAISTSRLAVSLVEDLQNSYQNNESKLLLAEESSEVFQNAISQCFLAYEQFGELRFKDIAFEISEKSKSAVLLSYLREVKARNFGGIPEEYLHKEDYLARQISMYKEYIYEESQNEAPDSAKLELWSSYLFKFTQEHEELLDRFEHEYPDYYALKYKNEVSSVQELQKTLAFNTTLIEFSVSDSLLYTHILTKKEHYIHKQIIDSKKFQSIKDYLNVFQNFDFSRQSYSGFTEFAWNANYIYEFLIGQHEEYIQGDNLVIIPDGILSYIPFESLVVDIPNKLPDNYYRGLDYLLRNFSVSYAYSSTLYAEVMKKSRRHSSHKLLAFAPEYNFSGETELVLSEFRIRQQYRESLYPIPGVKEEIESLRNLLPMDVFSGKSANETNFLQHASDYDILHLAMHTVVDNQNPMYSKLIFSQTEDSLNDGLLNTYEIFNLNLKAKMVVLSACSTGEGDFHRGEGVMSLARSFVYAGSPSLVMTLWEVEDKSGVKLMKDFYQNLLKGMTKSEALRLAKLKFIEEARPENSHPFFWSSYVVLGNSQPIYRSQILSVIVIFSVVTTLGIFIMFLMRKRNERS